MQQPTQTSTSRDHQDDAGAVSAGRGRRLLRWLSTTVWGLLLVVTCLLAIWFVLSLATGRIRLWDDDEVKSPFAVEVPPKTPKKKRFRDPNNHFQLPPSIKVGRMSFSSDGRRLLVEFHQIHGMQGEKDTTRRLSLFDPQSGEELWTVRDPDTVTYAFWVPGTRHIILTDWDDRISVWDADKGPPGQARQAVRRFGNSSQDDYVMAISADGRRAITVGSSWSSSNKVWDVQSGKLLHSLSYRGNLIQKAALSPDGKLALTSFQPLALGPDRRADDAALWDVDKGIPLRVWEWDSGWGGGVFTPESLRAISRVRLQKDVMSFLCWDIKTSKQLWTAARGFADAFTPDGKALLVLDRKGLRRISIDTGTETRKWETDVLKTPDWNPATCVAFSPDCIQLAVARGLCGPSVRGEAIRIELWDAKTGKLKRTLVEVNDPQ